MFLYLCVDVSYMTFVLPLFVPNIFFSWCPSKAMLRECDISGYLLHLSCLVITLLEFVEKFIRVKCLIINTP